MSSNVSVAASKMPFRMGRVVCKTRSARILAVALVMISIIASAHGVALDAGVAKPNNKIQQFASGISQKLLRRNKPVVVAAANHDHDRSVYSTFLVPLLAGGAATAFGDLAVHPLDTIKTVQQAAIAGSGKSTFLGACKGILQDNGITGFYKGVGPFVLLDGLAGCVKFATYELCKKFAAEKAPEAVKPYSHFAAAAVAFFACSIVLVPGELLKQTLQAGTYASLPAALLGVSRAQGFRGFYQGYGATLVRDVPYTMLELGLYDNAKRAIQTLLGPADGKGSGQSSQQLELIAAALVGGFTGYVTNPLDIVKTRLMTTAFPAGMRRPSVVKIFLDMWRKEGPGSLMAGSVARACWLIPFTAIYLPAYDEAKRWLLGRPAAAPRPGGRKVDSLVRVPD